MTSLYRCDRMQPILAETELEAAYTFARRLARRDHGMTGFVGSVVATGPSAYRVDIGKRFRRGREPLLTRTINIELERIA